MWIEDAAVLAARAVDPKAERRKIPKPSVTPAAPDGTTVDTPKAAA
jgi:hypothetical protein